MLSLGSRVIFGACLWTIGLFTLAGVVLTQVMFRHPDAPGVFHRLFAQALPLSLLAVFCLAVGLVQVRRGLHPLRELRDRLAAIHDGRARGIDGRYPAEVQPLVDDLNALLEHRERAVGRALAKAGDLAHGLKTPLAVLAQEALRASDSALANLVGQQTDRMRRQIDYHLAQARASASGGAPGAARSSVLESAAGLVRVMERLHVARGLMLELHVLQAHAVRAQREDLDEMLGNLIDNACKWAQARVGVGSADEGAHVVIRVDDDGPGIAPELRDAVWQRGVRADEAAPGTGLGLAIVRDLAELYGGSVALADSPLGGTRVELRLPAARADTRA